MIALGEDSLRQFKRDVTNVDALAAELCAFANTEGGVLLIGVSDAGEVTGLTTADVARINQLLSNAASQHVRPPVNPVSRNVSMHTGIVMVIEVTEGLNRPYVDLQGRIWVKSGADKRQVTAREEMQRMFQQSGLVYADEVPVAGSGFDDVDQVAFEQYFERRYHKAMQATGLSTVRLLQNLHLASHGTPNLASLLLFGKVPQVWRPAFVVKAVAFAGTALHDQHFLDSQDLSGRLDQVYESCMAFVGRNLRHVQKTDSFNRPGELEVPYEVFEELLVNALVHRDYFISAPIRLMIFSDRVELISPGHLPNHLNVEQIRYGLSNLRNPALASHAFHILPYRGLGSGIPRATAAWADLELIDDRQGNQFKAIVRRPPQVTPQVTPQVPPQVPPQVAQLLNVMVGDMTRLELMQALQLKDRKSFTQTYLLPAINHGLIEMTQPDKPRSSKQRYRTSAIGVQTKFSGPS